MESIVGEKGERGDDGTGIDVPMWAEGVYREGAEVQHHFGQYFRALQDTAESPDNPEHWQRVGSSGFRLAGTFSKDAEYRDGDLYVKDFGLFLYADGKSTCIAGRGPEGKKGKQGAPGRAGSDGADGRDGKDGSVIDALELRGANLVAVFRNADGTLKDHSVSLEPFLETAAVVTKEAAAIQNKEVVQQAKETVEKLWAHLQEHLEDQDAVPIRFYRGLWTATTSYQVGDWVKYAGKSYLCRASNTNQTPTGGLKKTNQPGQFWFELVGASGGSTEGDGGAHVTPNDVLVKENGVGGYKFSNFGMTMNGPIDVVGLQDGKNVRATLTTDLVETNAGEVFRDAKGRFRSVKDYEDLTNQMKVNRFIADELDALNEAIENIDFPEGADLSGYATKAQLDALAEESALTDNSLYTEIDQTSKTLTAAIAVVESDVQREKNNRIEADAALQEQIDAIEFPDGADLGPVEGRLDDIEEVLPKVPLVIEPVDIGPAKTLIDYARPTQRIGKASRG